MFRSRPRKIQPAFIRRFNLTFVLPNLSIICIKNIKIPISLKSSQALKFLTCPSPKFPRTCIYHTLGLSRREEYMQANIELHVEDNREHAIRRKKVAVPYSLCKSQAERIAAKLKLILRIYALISYSLRNMSSTLLR